ncbi:NADP-dependent malic enzyme [Patescibacteria group bacterium]|nr:MAG: NADP-dependent malic enzyme [Patescibacteria group bacterium]
MADIAQESLDLHRAHKGKLEVASKVPVKDRAALSRVYTPGVGAVSTAIGEDKTRVWEYTMKGNMVAVVTDGSAILGLGNLGPEAALPVMEGKAVLFKELAGVDAFPLCLATQDPDEIVAAVKAIAPVFGGINLEDIAAPKCFDIEKRLQDALDIPVVHDDQHGTAMVVLAAFLNALKVKGAEAGAVRVVMNGAGAAGVAVAKMLLAAGVADLTICDSKGVIHAGREGLTDAKRELAARTNPRGITGTLADAVKGADVFVGVSVAGALSGDMVRTMRTDPIVFALANPTPEIMPDEAAAAGALIVATGRSDFPNQINNALGFPGIFRGALDHRVRRITDDMLTQAARNLAAVVETPDVEHIMPDIFDPKVVPAVADAIC